MKISYYFIFILFSNLTFAQDIDFGTNLNAYYKQNSNEYILQQKYGTCHFFDDVDLVQIANKKEPTSYPILVGFITSGKLGLFAAYKKGSSPNQYFIDTDSDGIVDFKSNDCFTPGWISYFFDIPRGDMSEFENIMTKIYGIFNSRTGPDDNNLPSLYKTLINKLRDPNSINRDLYFSFWCYMNDGVPSPIYGVGLLTALINRIESKYQKKIPLLYLYLGETYDENSDYVNALLAFKSLVDIDSGSLIGNYYIAEMASKAQKDSSSLVQFLKQYPDFWMLNRH